LNYRNIIAAALFFTTLGLGAQKKNDTLNYKIRKITSPIKIDGKLDEAAWNDMDVAKDFFQVLPMDTSKATLIVEARMGYDEKNIYFSFVNYNNVVDGKWIVESLKRDYLFNRNDNNLLFFDTFDDQTNGYGFGSNAYGALWDALLFDGGSADLGWENKWQSETSHDDKKWIWEGAIPFKTLRYKKGIEKWGVNFTRLDLKTTEKSSWGAVPRQFPTSSLAFTGNLLWDTPPPPQGMNVSLIPYVTARTSKDIISNKPSNNKFDFGGDAKIALSSALNLDLTFNPDFSQVEVDRQQVNLDRFELFFPERRQFFIENGDLFTNFGFQNIRPFFSRRIGLNAPISNGARLSGKLNRDWRIGALNVMTSKVDQNIPSQNFTTIALQRRVLSRSNIAVMMVNKQSFNIDKLAASEQGKFNAYNRNLGLEYNLASSNNLWKGKMMYLRSFGPKSMQNDYILSGNLVYASKHWNINSKIERVGENYTAEVGFVPRTNYSYANVMIGNLSFPSKSKKILSHGPSVGGNFFFNLPMSQNLEQEIFMFYKVNFRSTASLSAWTSYDYQKLQFNIDPTNFAGQFLAKGTEHTWNAWGVEFSSAPQKTLTGSFASRYGGYYADGNRLRLTSEIGYRIQPYVLFGMGVNYNNIVFKDSPILPDQLKNKEYNFWLLSPRIDVTLSNKLFFSGIAQYNDQINNTNLNFRFQWRYNPASDMYLVYTDNYFTDMFRIKNRSIVFKFNYWWNV
jgi:hypothetical protein